MYDLLVSCPKKACVHIQQLAYISNLICYGQQSSHLLHTYSHPSCMFPGYKLTLNIVLTPSAPQSGAICILLS